MRHFVAARRPAVEQLPLPGMDHVNHHRGRRARATAVDDHEIAAAGRLDDERRSLRQPAGILEFPALLVLLVVEGVERVHVAGGVQIDLDRVASADLQRAVDSVGGSGDRRPRQDRGRGGQSLFGA